MPGVFFLALAPHLTRSIGDVHIRFEKEETAARGGGVNDGEYSVIDSARKGHREGAAVVDVLRFFLSKRDAEDLEANRVENDLRRLGVALRERGQTARAGDDGRKARRCGAGTADDV